MSNTSDAILIQRVLTGDTEAFAPLLQRYEASVYGLMLRLTGSETEAEELTQEAFVSAYIHWQTTARRRNSAVGCIAWPIMRP